MQGRAMQTAPLVMKCNLTLTPFILFESSTVQTEWVPLALSVADVTKAHLDVLFGWIPLQINSVVSSEEKMRRGGRTMTGLLP